jgi:catechol 2,3-dioxygenase
MPLSDLRLGAVHLTVTDLARSLAFYEGVCGLIPERRNGRVRLAPAGGTALVDLTERRDLRAPSAGPGLFHLALLLPSRTELARALVRLEAHRWPLHGASDHGVSEALYLADPDGHGIEIYADRPRATWRHAGGEVHMVTEPLDLRSLLADLPPGESASSGLPRGTVVGHVHLRVRDLDQAEAFFAGVLGLDVTVRDYPGARFFSAGGYHHHVGTNVWWRRGHQLGGDGRVGLEAIEFVVPAGDLPALVRRAGATDGTRALCLAGPDAGYEMLVRDDESST